MNVNVTNQMTFDQFTPLFRSVSVVPLGIAVCLLLLTGTALPLTAQPEVQLNLVDEAIVSGGALRAKVRITNPSGNKITLKRPESFAGAVRLTTGGEEVPIAAERSDAAENVTLFQGETISRTVEIIPEQTWDQVQKLEVSWSFGDLSAGTVPAFYFPERYGKIDVEGYGPIYVQFYFEDAPRTLFHVTRFIRNDVYDGLTFHRLIKDFLIQGGKPSADSDVHGTDLPAEVTDHKHAFGTVSMANGHRTKTAGPQFFITLGRQPFLDGRYTVIGKVTDANSRQRLRRIQNEVKTDHHKLGGRCGVDHLDRPQEPLVMKTVSLITPETYKQEQSEGTSSGNAGKPESSNGSGTNAPSSSDSNASNR